MTALAPQNMAQLECAAAPVLWSDGFETTTSSNATTLIRAKNVRRRFLRIYDDAIPNELCAALTEDAVKEGGPGAATCRWRILIKKNQ